MSINAKKETIPKNSFPNPLHPRIQILHGIPVPIRPAKILQ